MAEETQLGASVQDLIGGPDTCPGCGEVLRDDHLVDGPEGSQPENVDGYDVVGAESGLPAEAVFACPDGPLKVVKTAEGYETWDAENYQ